MIKKEKPIQEKLNNEYQRFLISKLALQEIKHRKIVQKIHNLYT